MSNLNGVTTKKGKIGANTISADDSVSGLFIIAETPPSGMDHDELYIFYNLANAEEVGITPDYDSIHNINVYRHVREFYRMAGEGVELYVMIISNEDVDDDVDMIYSYYIKSMIIGAEGKIRQLAIVRNRLPLDTPVYLDGIDVNISNAMPYAQALADFSSNNNMPLHILMECYAVLGHPSGVLDLRTLPYPKVSLVVGQDWNHAESKTGHAQKYADAGTALGTVAAARINQNIGENESFNLTDLTKNAWKIPGLSSHQKNSDLFTQLQTLEDKGYIFGINYVGIEGVRWNNDHVCAEIILDAEGNINAHTIAYSRTEDKAERLLRTAYLPELKKTYPVDISTGLLPTGVVKNLEGKGNTVFADMVRRREISGGVVIVDPTSDLIVEKKLKTKYRIVPYGTIGEISGTINLKTNL